MNWIAIYTRARHECSVARQLQKMGYETYVPMRREVHQWSDRKRFVNVPLMPSYVFIRIPMNLYYKIYDAQGVVRIVMFNGRIAVIREDEIEMLREAGKCKEVILVSTREFEQGDEVEIVEGKFTGFRGKVFCVRNSNKVGLEIQELGYTVVVDRDDLRLVYRKEFSEV